MHTAKTNGGTKCCLNISDAGTRFSWAKLAAAVIRGALIPSVLCMLLIVAVPPALAQYESLVYSFEEGEDAQFPLAGPTFYHGNLYGTTYVGGDSADGAVYEVPAASGSSVIYSFCSAPNCADGWLPYSDVIFDSSGNIYGTTNSGGANGQGVVFELSLLAGSWTETVLYSFCSQSGCSDGGNPFSGVVMDAAGNLYGTNSVGVFELNPSSGGWTEQIIYNAGSDNNPFAGLTIDAAGNLFGITTSTVFELSPNGSGGWNLNVIHTFPGFRQDGVRPLNTPVFDQFGVLYGSAAGARTVVYKLIPGTKKWNKGKWKEEIVYFTEADGMVIDAAGNIYGITTNGTYPPGFFNQGGTVFELVAPTAKGRGYRMRHLWAFSGNDGLFPVGNPVLDSENNIYGATYWGGPEYGEDCEGGQGCGQGVVFKVTP